MKHLYYGQAEFLVGDDVADVLVEYAVQLANRDRADSVRVVVLGPDGNLEESTFLLTAATPITVETTRSDLDEPDNSEAITYMRERMAAMVAQPLFASPDDTARSHLPGDGL